MPVFLRVFSSSPSLVCNFSTGLREALKFSTVFSKSVRRFSRLREDESSTSAENKPDAQKPTLDDRLQRDLLLASNEFMRREVEFYYQGRRRLAKMMGINPDLMTDKELEDAIKYLLPTSLYAKDARPTMKHPFEVFPKRKEALFGPDGRPKAAGFYTGSPAYQDFIYDLNKQQSLIEKASQRENKTDSVSAFEASEDGPCRWLTKEELESKLGENISEKQYEVALKRLSYIASLPHSVKFKDFFGDFRKAVPRPSHHAKEKKVDYLGRAYGTGKRKCSVARVWVSRGCGQIQINGTQFLDYFTRLEDRQQVMYPFIVTNTLLMYDVKAVIEGGGPSGQTGALRHGISRALLNFSDSYGPILEKEGLLIRDPRMVERKKAGQKKARKKFTWVKR
ncbi:small ribosomal subunit protein uS9m-like [Oscarella lobularis]|uniref:small ribosomal subunit protein uS9m-like n=1 Tax=Oscarella lobularis TaxID=121494 RepID=UPI0033141FDA